MQKLTAKKLIAFRRLPQTRKQTFVNNLKSPPANTDGGGDYWISSISSITNACKNNDTGFINSKIDYLSDQFKTAPFKRTKDMYQRNIDILSNYKEYDFAKLKPKKVLEFQTKPNTKSILTIKGLPVQVSPSHVFSYKNQENQEIGAIWFIAQLNGFKLEELGIFSELLYRYLITNYAKKHTINPNFCVAIDVVNCREIKYSRLLDGNIDSLLDVTIEDLKMLLKK